MPLLDPPVERSRWRVTVEYRGAAYVYDRWESAAADAEVAALSLFLEQHPDASGKPKGVRALPVHEGEKHVEG